MIQHTLLALVTRIGLIVFLMTLGAASCGSDFSTMSGKHVVGYQGWFACPSDPVDPRWSHWFRSGSAPTSATLTVDLWPDLSEFEKTDLCSTGLRSASERPALVFSSQNAATLRRHFQWMREYNIDGAAIQRFLSQVLDLRFRARLDLILANARMAAEREGRGFFVMYDLSGLKNDGDVFAIEQDWLRLTNHYHLQTSRSYMRHRGKPVVGLWGLGLRSSNATPLQANTLIRFFKETANVTLLGGVAAHWRTLDGDALPATEWHAVYRSFDILSPWTVGRFGNLADADDFANRIMALDIKETLAKRQDYMPVIFPGFSWHNLKQGRAPLDQIPRLCGEFYARQAHNALRLGATMVYTAMFDELDEGTAIFKIVRQPHQLPLGATLLAPDQHCEDKRSDLYLRAAGTVTDSLRHLLQR